MMNSGKPKPLDLSARTKDFAVRIIGLASALTKGSVEQVLGKQILRSGTSVGAPYREAARARSKVEFVSKLQSATPELDETLYWLELLVAAKIVPEKRLTDLRQEAHELLAIFVASAKTAKSRNP